jgi:long-chain acyl-CoA synthetase
LPYAEVAERAARLATSLSARGIGRGTPVALLVPNSPELFTPVYALFALGAIAVPLSGGATRAELLRAFRSCRVAAVIARDDLLPLARGLVEEQAPGRDVPLIGVGEVEGLMRAGPLSPPALPGDTVALYLSSSGSTGRPKVVPHTHAEMLAEGQGAATAEGLTPDDIVFNSLPGHHGFGFMTVHFEAAAAGATTCYWTDTQPWLLSRDRVLAAISAERITVLTGVPFALDALAGASGGDLGRVRLAFTGGVSLKRPVFDRFLQRFGLPLGQSYGSTESGQVAFNSGATDESWASCGPAQSNASFELLPAAEAPEGIGEVLIRGPSLTSGYLEADAASQAAFRDGGFLTGDLGRFDARGNLYITGRRKFIIEVAGHKVDPIEIEDVLAEHPAVAEAVVVGVPDPRTGEQRLKLVAVLSGEARDTDLIGFARARLSPQKVPALVEFRDAIPRSATGKVLRGKLMEEG